MNRGTSPANTFAPVASGHNTPLITLPLGAHDAPLPAADFEDFHINYQWRRLFAPLATRLLNRNIYDGTEAEIDTAIQQAHALLADLYPLVVILAISHALIVDEKPTGVDGGTSVAGWNARDLNKIANDPDVIAALDANKITPVAGDYAALVIVPTEALVFARHAARFVNDTTAVVVSKSNGAQISGNLLNVMVAIFTANGTDEYRLDTYHESGVADTGFGENAGDGSPERYASVYLLKIG